MKLQIAIVDDLAIDRQRLDQDIQSWLAAEDGTLGTVRCFSDAQELLSQFEPGEYHIIFMDICMDDLNGIEAAKRIRAMDTRVLIIFLTSSEEYAFDAFPVHPFDYILKPYNKERLDAVLAEAKRVLTAEEKTIEIRAPRARYVLPVRNISAAVSNGHSVEIVTRDGPKILSNNTFGEVEAELMKDGRFLNCNRGIIINMDQVASMDSEVFYMKNGTQYAMRVRGRSQIIREFSRYQLARMQRREEGL